MLERRAIEPKVHQQRLVSGLDPWRRPWVREFLEVTASRLKTSTQHQILGSLTRLDCFLTSLGDGDPRTWAGLTPDHLTQYIARTRPYALEDAKPFFAWLTRRKGLGPFPIPSHRGGLQHVHPLPHGRACDLFALWTAPEANPQWKFPALLALVHGVPPSRLRHLRVSDVVVDDGQLRLQGFPPLTEPVNAALATFLDWRAAHYVGPSTYLLVTRSNRFVNRPVSEHVLYRRVYQGESAVAMRQATIRELIDAGLDPVDLQSFTGLNIDTVDAYTRVLQKYVPVKEPDVQEMFR